MTQRRSWRPSPAGLRITRTQFPERPKPDRSRVWALHGHGCFRFTGHCSDQSSLPASQLACGCPGASCPSSHGLLEQGSRGRQPVSTAWLLAHSLVSPQRSKPAAFPDRYLILVLEGSQEAAECLLHCSHHHSAPSAPGLCTSGLHFMVPRFLPAPSSSSYASPFLQATSSPNPTVY